MRVVIVGVGAIGGTFLAFLTRGGVDATGLLKRGRNLEELYIEGIWGEFGVKVKTVDDPKRVDFVPDLIVISVKSYDTEQALNLIEPLVGERTLIMIAQNGYGNYEKAVEKYERGRVILARVIFGAKRLEGNRIRITVCADDVVIGDPSGVIEDRILEEIAETFSRAGIPMRHEREVYKYLWDKIIYNSALNPLGALFEVSYGQLAENPHTKDIMDRIIEEIFYVIRFRGIETFWRDAQEYREVFYSKLIPSTADHYPSMLEDLRRGKTEIDSLNGAVCKLAQEIKVEVPTNEMILKIIKAKELFNRRRSL